MKENNKNKKIIYIICLSMWLILALFKFSPILLNLDTAESNVNLSTAIIIELILSLPMSYLVILPISKMFSQDNYQKIFVILSAIRISILLFCNIIFSTNIYVFDILALFISIFLVVPLLSKITGKQINYKTSKSQINEVNSSLNNVPTEVKIETIDNNINPTTTEIIPKNAVSSANFDSMYSLSDDLLLTEFINRELIKVGIDKNYKLLPKDILKRKNVLGIIFLVLVFLYISAIFFHFPIFTYIIGFIILLIFRLVTKKYNYMKYLKKQITARPSEKISNIIMSYKSSCVENNRIWFLIGMLIAIIIPICIFINPRIFYEKVDNGYAVRFYPFGLSNYKTATIPDVYKGEKVVSLRGNAFSNMFFLEKVTLPDTIIEIRGQAFKNDYNLLEVNIPKQLEYLGGGAFYNCYKLAEIDLPPTITYIGGEAFYNNFVLKHIELPENITEIRGNTFDGCRSLESIKIPDNVVRIAARAFYQCSSLSEVIITENSKLEEIGSSAFRLCDNLYSITLPQNVYINERAFKESPTLINYYNN